VSERSCARSGQANDGTILLHCRKAGMGTRLGRLTSGARARNKYTTATTYLQPHAYNISTGGHDNIILYTHTHTHPHTHTHAPTYPHTRKHGHIHTPGESDHGIFSLKNVTSHDPAINHVCFIYYIVIVIIITINITIIICVIRSEPLSERMRHTLCLDFSPRCC